MRITAATAFKSSSFWTQCSFSCWWHQLCNVWTQIFMVWVFLKGCIGSQFECCIWVCWKSESECCIWVCWKSESDSDNTQWVLHLGVLEVRVSVLHLGVLEVWVWMCFILSVEGVHMQRCSRVSSSSSSTVTVTNVCSIYCHTVVFPWFRVRRSEWSVKFDFERGMQRKKVEHVEHAQVPKSSTVAVLAVCGAAHVC